jgi:hypothetical protein
VETTGQASAVLLSCLSVLGIGLFINCLLLQFNSTFIALSHKFSCQAAYTFNLSHVANNLMFCSFQISSLEHC